MISARCMSNLTLPSSREMAKAARATIAFVPYLLQNVLPCYAWVMIRSLRDDVW